MKPENAGPQRIPSHGDPWRYAADLEKAAARLEEAAQDAWDALVGGIPGTPEIADELDKGIEAVRKALSLNDAENAMEAVDGRP